MSGIPMKTISLEEMSGMFKDKDKISIVFLFLSAGLVMASLVFWILECRSYGWLLIFSIFCFFVFYFHRAYFIARKEINAEVKQKAEFVSKPANESIQKVKVENGLNGENELGDINFHYLPSTPLEYGWKLVEGILPQFLIDQTCPISVKALQIIYQGRYAMDYYVNQTQSMAEFIEVCLRFGELGAFYFKVKMSNKEGNRNFDGWLCYKPEHLEPMKTRFTDEWALPIEGETLNGGWIKNRIFLANDVEKSWGKEGWVYCSLICIRFRGSLSLSPIAFYRMGPVYKSTNRLIHKAKNENASQIMMIAPKRLGATEYVLSDGSVVKISPGEKRSFDSKYMTELLSLGFKMFED